MAGLLRYGTVNIFQLTDPVFSIRAFILTLPAVPLQQPCYPAILPSPAGRVGTGPGAILGRRGGSAGALVRARARRNRRAPRGFGPERIRRAAASGAHRWGDARGEAVGAARPSRRTIYEHFATCCCSCFVVMLSSCSFCMCLSLGCAMVLRACACDTHWSIVFVYSVHWSDWWYSMDDIVMRS